MAPIGVKGEGRKVVVAYLDRRREKGMVYDFKPFGEGFTLYRDEPGRGEVSHPIEFKAIKAVYFVKSHEGNRDRRENKLALGPVYRQGRKVSVSFADGERYVGITEGFNPSRAGFFFFPGDPASNNLEVFIVTVNTEEVRLIGAEPGGGDRVHRATADRGVFLPEMRLKAVQRVMRGEPVAAVAKDLSVPPETLFDWKARFLSGGPAALGILPPPAAPGTPGAPSPPKPPAPPTTPPKRPW